MTQHSNDPHRVVRRMGVAAFAALALAACSSPSGSSSGSSSVTVTVTPPPPPVTVTAPPQPPTTVTVTPPPPASGAHYTGPGSFQSPSGNILCLISSAGEAQCEVVDHGWTAPPKDPQCHLNWGSRLSLTQGGAAVFACYAQELPAAQRALNYGATWSSGSITCDSEIAGITCTDSGTGHHFFVSRDSYQLG